MLRTREEILAAIDAHADELFWAKADEIRKGLAGRTFQDSTELIREDRER